MSASTSDSLRPKTSTDCSPHQRPKILEALGCRVTILAHFVVTKARDLPMLGLPIGYFEDTLKPWVKPAITKMERDGLYLLSLVDNQIHAVSDVAKAHIPLAAKVVPQLQTLLSGQPIESLLMGLSKFWTRGVVGSTADMWVEYEDMVRNKSERISTMAERVPCVSLVLSIIYHATSPFVSFASDWLVTHTEIEDKHQILLCSDKLQSCDSPVSQYSEKCDNTAVEEAAADSHHQSDYPGPSGTTEMDENGRGERIDVPVQDEMQALKDIEGKPAGLIPVIEDVEEHDEVAELFDMWGMGAKAISPSGLKSLRAYSLKDSSNGSRKIQSKGQPKSKSFKF